MLSGKLVHLIESHWGPIISRVIDQIDREPEFTRFRAPLESELRDWGQDLLQNLGHWLAAGNEEDLARKYRVLGKVFCEEDVPLHEAVRGLCILRENLLDYVEEHIFSKNVLELYAEEELDRRLGRFFDLLTIHVVEGYERALRKTAVAHAV